MWLLLVETTITPMGNKMFLYCPLVLGANGIQENDDTSFYNIQLNFQKEFYQSAWMATGV